MGELPWWRDLDVVRDPKPGDRPRTHGGRVAHIVDRVERSYGTTATAQCRARLWRPRRADELPICRACDRSGSLDV